jgi:DNA-binding MarR family transcriptional regulator
VTRYSDPHFNATESIEKELLLGEMMKQVANLQKKFQSEGEDDERRWMIANANDPKIVEFLKESTVMMLHVIDAIGELEPVNGITISKKFGIPRGSVSKITRKLAELQMVQPESIPDNKKEVLFHLTERGRHVFNLHKQLHLHIEYNVRHFLDRYDVEQMRFLVQCMKDTSEASWVQGEPSDGRVETTEAGRIESMTIHSRASKEAGAISEIISMLQQLDERNLRKAKELIQVAFFD